MTAKAMRALLWKDFRVNRKILIISVILWVSPYVLALVIAAYHSKYGVPVSRAELLGPVAGPSIFISVLVSALLAGNAIAAERVDRSAAFLGYLPPSRLSVLASKAICGLAPSLLMMGGSAAIAIALVMTKENQPSRAAVFAWIFLGTGVSAFGGAWMAGSLLKSPAIAACAGIALPIALAFVAMQRSNVIGVDAALRLYRTAAMIAGVLCFIGGAIHYLRANPDT